MAWSHSRTWQHNSHCRYVWWWGEFPLIDTGPTLTRDRSLQRYSTFHNKFYQGLQRGIMFIGQPLGVHLCNRAFDKCGSRGSHNDRSFLQVTRRVQSIMLFFKNTSIAINGLPKKLYSWRRGTFALKCLKLSYVWWVVWFETWLKKICRCMPPHENTVGKHENSII